MESTKAEEVFSGLQSKFSFTGGGTSKNSGKSSSAIESRDAGEVVDRSPSDDGSSTRILTTASEDRSFKASIKSGGSFSSVSSFKMPFSMKKKQSFTAGEENQIIDKGAASVLKSWISTIRHERDQLRQDNGFLNEKLVEDHSKFDRDFGMERQAHAEELGRERQAHSDELEKVHQAHAGELEEELQAHAIELETERQAHADELGKERQAHAKTNQAYAKTKMELQRTKKELQGANAKIGSTTKELKLKLEELAKLGRENAKNKEELEATKEKLEELSWQPKAKSPFRKKKVIRRP